MNVFFFTFMDMRFRTALSERRYDVSLDDESFLMLQPASQASPQGQDEDANPPYIILVDNWFQELRELLGG